MYKVLEMFKDKDGKIYKKGDEYKNEDKERIEVLSSTDNLYDRPFIKKEVKRQKKKVVEVDGE